MMETHYNNPNIDPGIIDSSGVRIFYTPTLRKFDAGVISVGLDPNWRHIIPPGRPEVVSEGHCIADCTRQALPETGINVFATLLHTHLIGESHPQSQFRLLTLRVCIKCFNGVRQTVTPVAKFRRFLFRHILTLSVGIQFTLLSKRQRVYMVGSS